MGNDILHVSIQLLYINYCWNSSQLLLGQKSCDRDKLKLKRSCDVSCDPFAYIQSHRAKGLLDLKQCRVYQVHPSLYGKWVWNFFLRVWLLVMWPVIRVWLLVVWPIIDILLCTGMTALFWCCATSMNSHSTTSLLRPLKAPRYTPLTHTHTHTHMPSAPSRLDPN